jgi:hypothetical protein
VPAAVVARGWGEIGLGHLDCYRPDPPVSSVESALVVLRR